VVKAVRGDERLALCQAIFGSVATASWVNHSYSNVAEPLLVPVDTNFLRADTRECWISLHVSDGVRR
jgi:hypothetical protein